MLEVKVSTTVTIPEYQVFSTVVKVHGFDKLTPRAARAALQIAGYNTGEAWTMNPLKVQNENGEWIDNPEDDYGYRVYPKSARKLHHYNF